MVSSGRAVEKGTISISFVHEALECLRQRGIDENDLLKRSEISPELLGSPLARVSSQNYAVLWQLIAYSIDDEFFGMDSHPMKVGSFKMLCHSVIHSDTLRRALHRSLQFLRTVLDDIEGELCQEDGVASIVLNDLDRSNSRPGAPKRAFAYGTLFLILHGLCCWLVGRRIPLSSAEFRCDEPGFSAEWKVMFSPTLKFNQPKSRICFAPAFLDMPNIQNECTLKEFLRSAPANFLVKYKNSASISSKVRHRLREMPPATWPDFDTLAHQIHASSSTLRRRLECEGQSYRAIVDDLRRDMAISLLSHSDKSVMDIAAELGFAETSAFYRAFKKWTGARPGQYRHGVEVVQGE